MAQHDATLFKSPMAGEHCLHGFTNRDIRSRLTGTRWLRACADDPKKASAKVGRCFGRLHAHGLIAKIPRTRRWRVTDDGRKVGAPPRTCASTTSRTSTPASCTELLRWKQGRHSKRIYAPKGFGTGGFDFATDAARHGAPSRRKHSGPPGGAVRQVSPIPTRAGERLLRRARHREKMGSGDPQYGYRGRCPFATDERRCR